nr:helix-turn-helix domain-containing protein [Serratia proteamaculans]
MKPKKNMNRIIECIIDDIKPLDITAGKAVPISLNGHPRVIFLLKGSVECFRTHDNLLISEAKAPYIMGVMVNEVEDFYYYVKPAKNTNLGYVNYNDFISSVKKHDLWLDLLEIASHITSYLIHRDISLVNRDRYSVIMHYLKEIYSFTDEKRKGIMTTNYIVRRSGLSRSGVLAVLSELRKGKYISIENGVLTFLSDKVPKSF